MSLGKYLTNFGVIAALIGAAGTFRQTQAMPKDWRRFVVWGVWAAGLLLTVAGVAKQSDDEEQEKAAREAQRQAKKALKAAR
ncbi:hypothetical protein J4H92_09245 [Leucobacter weissii]|uniref:Uncharacterized protein n=1 Tax=Leucobacter weissii TaxID=1983706 RepID=A0A939MK99_9MICO|nr:hypothetical protein [Leucobacter weissii]MBO1902131.1 hypothetical protein [Leucobacter weissii]